MVQRRYEVQHPLDDTVTIEPVECEEVGGIPVGLFRFASAEALEWFLVETCRLSLDPAHACPECGTHLMVSARHFPAPPDLRNCPNGGCTAGLYEVRPDGLTPISQEGYREWYGAQRAAARYKQQPERILH